MPIKNAGFTLLELLVAMMIVILLVPVLYSSMQFAFKAKSSAEAAVEPPRTAELVMDMIRADLSQAMPPSPVDPTTEISSGLIGPFEGTDGTDDRGRDGDDLKFYTNAIAPQHGNASGNVNGEIKSDELCIMTTPNGNDHVLVRKIIRDLLAQTTPTPDVEVICRGVGGFNLRYYDGSKWNDTWDSTLLDNTIPTAVEVTLTLDRPNGSITNRDGSRSFRYVRVIPLACSTAAFDTNVNTGGTQ